MKKLKLKVEGWIDESDEDAQEPSFISLVPSNIASISTPPSPFHYP